LEKLSWVPTSVTTTAELFLLERGAIRVEVALRPFSFTVRRDGRRLLRAAGVWVAAGSVHDTFVQFTEGVIAREELSPLEQALRGEVECDGPDGVVVALALGGGRRARLRIALPAEDRTTLTLVADGEPLRLAIDWDRRSEESVRRARRAPLRSVRPGRPRGPARRRPAVYGTGLPAGHARIRRHSPGRLCTDAVVALEPWLRSVGEDVRQWSPV
jgi:hypothetical protein